MIKACWFLTLSLQINFQAVLSTDGQASFAAFTYSSPNDVLDITARWLIGFDAGDEVRGSVVLSGEEPTWNGFGNVNIFRIDGKRKEEWKTWGGGGRGSYSAGQ